MIFSSNEINIDDLNTLSHDEDYLMIKTDIHGVITEISPATLRKLNIKPQKIYGRRANDLFCLEPNIEQELEYFLKNKVPYKGVLRYSGSKWKKLYFKVSTSISNNNIIIIGVDITGLYRENLIINEQLGFLDVQNRNLKLLSTVASQTNASIVITNGSGEVEWVNDGFTYVTGYELNEVRGQKPGEFLQGAKTDLYTVERISKSLKSGIPVDEFILNYTKSGKEFYYRLIINPVKDETGAISHFIGIQTKIVDELKSLKSITPPSNEVEESLLSKKEELLFKDAFSNNATFSFMTYCTHNHFIETNRSSKEGGDVFFADFINNYLVVILISSEGTDTEKILLNNIILKEYQKHIEENITEPGTILSKIDLRLKNLHINHNIKTSTNVIATYYHLKTNEFGFSTAGIQFIKANHENEIQFTQQNSHKIASDKKNKYTTHVFHDVVNEKIYFHTKPTVLTGAQPISIDFEDDIHDEQAAFDQFLVNLIHLPFESQKDELLKVNKYKKIDCSIVGLEF